MKSEIDGFKVWWEWCEVDKAVGLLLPELCKVVSADMNDCITFDMYIHDICI